jgi:hypothetical protein
MRSLPILVLMAMAIGLSAQQPAAASPVPSASAFSISGTVVDSATGAPLGHTVVAIAPVTKRDDFRTMTTGEDGHFYFAELVKNKYTLSAQRRGYLSQSFDQHDQYSTSIAVGPGLESTGLVFRLRPEASVRGKITDDHGDPVANAQVFLFRIGNTGTGAGTNLQRHMNSDDEGSFHFAHLPPGKFYLVVSAQPWYTQGVVRNLAITHRAVDDTNKQQASDVSVETRSPLDLAFPITFYSGATDFAGATPIVLEPGSHFVADMILQPVPALHLVLKSANSIEPGKGRYATVTQLVAGTSINMQVSTTFLDQSTLSVSGLAPGSYKLDVITQAAAGEMNHSTRMIDVSGDAELSAEEGSASVQVTGSASFDNNASLPAHGFIQLRNRKTREAVPTQISAKGDFEWKTGVPPGSYDVSVSNIPDGFVKGITANGVSSSGHTITIKGSGPVKLAVILTQGVGRIEGTAMRDGKAIAGAMIVLVPDDAVHNAPLFRRDQSDSDGTFTLASVLPGKYTVLAIENGWELEWANPTVLKPYLSSGEVVSVTANGKYQVKVKVQ